MTLKAEAAALMRVNHVGEICAQARMTPGTGGTLRLRSVFLRAAQETTNSRGPNSGTKTGGRTSLLNPLWYGGAPIGLTAARLGDRASSGFMAEKRQVEQHLQGHLERLPETDTASRAIVAQMKEDETNHAQAATEHGGMTLPLPVRWAMRLAARVMTRTAHYI
jgi:ubiquinone biosynthesis monooxygenase Coq7